MPDRSKKRKKNKNKRKNRNNAQSAHNAKVLNASPDIGSCDESVASEVNDNSALIDNSSEFVDQVNQKPNQQRECELDVNIKGSGHINECLLPLQLEPKTYVVESPEQIQTSEKNKLSEIKKSKSLDNEDVPKIVEITEEIDGKSDYDTSVALLDCSAIVSEAESDVEWEIADNLISEPIIPESATAVGALKIDTYPLSIAECEQTQALSPEEELSLRQYLQTLNLVTCPQEVPSIEVEDLEIPSEQNKDITKIRKKGTTDDPFKSKPTISRLLDVIDEEGSNESSLPSRRQSYLKDDLDDLDDDVFLDKNVKVETLDTFPLPKSARTKTQINNSQLIAQECFLVGAKIVQPKLDEGCGEWTVESVAKPSGAEVVYLTDSSSSASDIYDICEDPEISEETDDSSIRILTPTIEVNGAHCLLIKDVLPEASEFKEIIPAMTKTPPSSPNSFMFDEGVPADCNTPLVDHAIENNNSEIIVLTTENKIPSLYVLRIDEDTKSHDSELSEKIHYTTPNDMKTKSPEDSPPNSHSTNTKISNIKMVQNVHEKHVTHFTLQEPKRKIDTEINDLKLELNDALTNLMKEVAAERNNYNVSNKDNPLCRQDSSSSIGSSQCTAKYNPTTSSLTDIAALVHDETPNTKNQNTHTIENTESHVKDVFDHVAGLARERIEIGDHKLNQPTLLKDLCVKRIASLPYGENILEELASVSERLQKINIFCNSNLSNQNMPFYPLPDVSAIKKVALPTNNNLAKTKLIPPPVTPRNSSLKIPHDEPSWTGVPTKKDPSLYLCLSPSQKMLMEKTNTVIDQDDANELLDIHTKYLDRRGYDEFYSNGRTTECNNDLKEPIPFKSKTGNRLLAIIRDPGINNNINNNLNKWNSFKESSHEYYRNRTLEGNASRYRNSQSAKDLRSDINFRPIPPPRPRKYSSAIYESDESSDFTDNSFQSVSEKKYFHYSTGNLNKDIERDVSSIQNMHRKYTTTRDNFKEKFLNVLDEPRRRPSLPKDLCEQQMEYIRQKEKEVEAEIRRLEAQKHNMPMQEKRGRRAPLYSESELTEERHFDANNYHISRKRDLALHSDGHQNGNKIISNSFKSSQEELLREKMYSEYMSQMAEREERKQHKVIKITTKALTNDSKTASASLPVLNNLNEIKSANNRIEEEFISKAKERWDKLGIKDPETEDERDKKDEYKEPRVVEHKVKVIEGGEEKDVQRLPSHLREFVQFAARDANDNGNARSPAVWSPGGAPPPPPPSAPATPTPAPPPPPPPAWSPSSGGASPLAPRRPFRPPTYDSADEQGTAQQNGRGGGGGGGGGAWESAPQLADATERRLPTSHSAPPAGLVSLGAGAGRLPRAQNPTITLLQKNREGQLRGAGPPPPPPEQRTRPRDRPSPPTTDPVHALRREYASEGESERGERRERDGERSRNMADSARKVEGIGPTTKEGMPVALRSEVKDPSRWYKKMYDTIHKSKYDDDYVTIRYKSRRGEPSIQRTANNRSQYAYFDPRSGYLSEPEGGGAGAGRGGGGAWSDAYDSDVTGGTRRRTASVQGDAREYEATPYMPSTKYSTLASARASQEVYKSQPGKIENYMPGRSSVVDKEAKQWWDEVMDIFDGQLSSPSTASLQQPSPKEKKDVTTAILSKSNMARALKESGYESDSTLVFRRRADETEAPLSPAERRAAYRDLQAGGEPPARGFRSPAPPRHQDDSDIEYIPISPTLTKIRIHKKKSRPREVVCYPTNENREAHKTIYKFKRNSPSFISINIPSHNTEPPPPPPRRVSSRNNRTLKLVSSVKSASISPSKKVPVTVDKQSNINFLKDKIRSKLSRQGTQIISKSHVSDLKMKEESKPKITRTFSTSAPPALNRTRLSASSPVSQTHTAKKTQLDTKSTCTSSFRSPRRTVPPTQYSNPTYCRYDNTHPTRVPIEGGAGRKTPITNILDRVTSLDKLWSSDQRCGITSQNKSKTPTVMDKKIIAGKCDSNLSKAFSTPNIKAKNPTSSYLSSKSSCITRPSNMTISTVPRGRDLLRGSERLSRLRQSNTIAKSTPSLASSYSVFRSPKSTKTQEMLLHRQMVPDISDKNSSRTVKIATVSTLKKRVSLEDLTKKVKNPSNKLPSKETTVKKSLRRSIKSKNHKDFKTKTSTNDSESGSQFEDTLNEVSNFDSPHILDKKTYSEEIKTRRNAVMSDSFFQHLFFQNASPPQSITSMIDHTSTSVLEKAKLFQSYPVQFCSPRSINSYLIHRKPVSQSRFRVWDKFPFHVRSQSPRSVSWPGRMYHEDIKKFDSLSSKTDEFGSTSSLTTYRSKSEPPSSMIFFSQTSRPKSPIIIYHKKETQKTLPKSPPIRNISPPHKFVFSQTSRPVSPKVIHTLRKKPKTRDESPSPTRIVLSQTSRPISPAGKKWLTAVEKPQLRKSPTRLVFTETSRPISPVIAKKDTVLRGSISRSHSPSPTPIRSPSYRRIHSARSQATKYLPESSIKKNWRTRSVSEIEDDIRNKPLKCKTYSTPALDTDPDFSEYILDMQNSKSRSERFRELNRYYSYLERVGELERATSTRDLRHRKKDEEIIDFDRWKKIRVIERAEEELEKLYDKLKTAQKEDDVLFYPRDVKDFRWTHNKDRSLKIKEKSVENLKEHFKEMSELNDCVSYVDGLNLKDAYTPLWRGNSVADVAFNLNKRNEISTTFPVTKPVTSHQDTSLADLRRKLGLGSRLWSSLSMDQVNTLKNQLNAIYSKDPEQKAVKAPDEEKYMISVTKDDQRSSPSLHVRCSSLTTDFLESQKQQNHINKSDSISAINYTEKEFKNNVNNIQMALSENEKKRISHTLSKEFLDRVKKIETPSDHECSNKQYDGKSSAHNDLEYPTEIPNKKEETKRHVIYPPENKTEISVQASSASETETASSDQSNNTVIFRPKKEVKSKVEYFETVNSSADKHSIVYHARNDSVEQEKTSPIEIHIPVDPKTTKNTEERSVKNLQSQSCANFKELFGETEANKYSSLPLKSGSPTLQSGGYRDDRYTPDTLRYSSEETLCRSRSDSPDPERYWRAYLNLVKAGEVKRLARRFDSPSSVTNATATPSALRRYRSDPEIARSVLRRNWSTIKRVTLKGHERGDVDRLTHGYETRGRHRSRCRAVSPVPKVPLRAADRFMPHIDVISKLAALRRRTAAPARSRSADAPAECPAGEVERIRRRFESMSPLGQMYTSSPDVRELRDVAPHLAGAWAAHRYPGRRDNNRSLSDGSFVLGRRSPVRRLRSVSPAAAVRPSSILKPESTVDVFANQPFDPAKHRPVYRYQPPPPRPPTWPHHPAPHSARPTVTFQEPDTAPIPPPKRAPHGSYSDTESPRRYVESDVNIHYRCPVRRNPLPHVPERELARRQAEHMRRLYQEERRRKYLQDVNPLHIEAFDQSIKELQDMQSRRHTDNFTPSQKAVVPLNRYDEPLGTNAKRAFARALYAFAGQSPRELTFRKGDVIGVRRQIDANWYEGELSGKVGLFPYNYVEIVKSDSTSTGPAAGGKAAPAPETEGRARAKFDFTAQTSLELPLKKGEVVLLTRRVDNNWWEGRRGTATGIFPDSYVQVLAEPSLNKPEPLTPLSNKPLASPASHGLLSSSAKPSMGAHSYQPQQPLTPLSNKPLASPASHGLLSSSAKPSMGAHSYQPQLNSASLSNGPQPTQPLHGQYPSNYHAKPAQATLTPAERGYGPPSAPGLDLNNHEPLYIDTNAEAVPYRAMYKYRPQNPDELELTEGDTVYVLEQCDDGWYVGSSQRSGKFGTFPGNYVERI